MCSLYKSELETKGKFLLFCLLMIDMATYSLATFDILPQAKPKEKTRSTYKQGLGRHSIPCTPWCGLTLKKLVEKFIWFIYYYTPILQGKNELYIKHTFCNHLPISVPNMLSKQIEPWKVCNMMITMGIIYKLTLQIGLHKL